MRKISILAIFAFLQILTYANTRVAYLRPGPMMKIPYTSIAPSPYFFTAGTGTEIHNLAPFNTATGAYYSMDFTNGWSWGVSTATGGDTTRLANLEVSTYKAPVEFGFHFQKRVLVRDNISFSLGLQDIIFENNKAGLNLDPAQLSFFGIVSSESEINNYTFNTFIGFGTGGFGAIDTVKAIDSLATEPASTKLRFYYKLRNVNTFLLFVFLLKILEY